jgi:Transposase IS116/IS110/IS902 family
MLPSWPMTPARRADTNVFWHGAALPAARAEPVACGRAVERPRAEDTRDPARPRRPGHPALGERPSWGQAQLRRPGRLRSEAAWAHLCAAAPIPASSGKVARHRLNRGGDRQANHALWRIVLTPIGSHPPTRAYVARRSKEGLSKPEIIRCLKRYPGGGLTRDSAAAPLVLAFERSVGHLRAST